MSNKHKDTIEDDELPVIALDYKRRKATEKDFKSTGWKFYLRFKELLPDWWYEFNGDIKSNHKPKYRNAFAFARHKIKNKEERQYLLWMIGPKKIYEREARDGKRFIVPWLGDWEARRRNGRWEPENKVYLKQLRNAIKENVKSAEAIKATSPFVVKSLMRLERLADKVDDLFDGQPFEDDNPHSKNNYKRFKLYTSMHNDVEEAKSRIYDQWMRIHGVDPKDPHGMWDMNTMAQMVGQSAAAGALTGFTVMQGMDGKPNGDGMMSLNNNSVMIPKDALLLANHLISHQNKFKRPIPIIDAEPIKDKEENKSNGHAKAN